jgi:hypothetical protein
VKKKLASVRIFRNYFSFKLQIVSFLSSIDCTGTDLGFQISPKKNLADSSQVSVKAKKLELHNRDHSSVQDNFRPPTNTLHHCNIVEHRRVETRYEDASSNSPFKCIRL